MRENAAEPEMAQGYPVPARIFNCSSGVSFLRTLASAVLEGAMWDGVVPPPAALSDITIYLPGLAAVEPLKRAFLSLTPGGATFLPRIRVLGETDPLDMYATFGTCTAQAEVARGLLAKALEIPPVFDQLERQLQLAGLVLKASKALQSTQIEPGEALFVELSPASAFVAAGRIASLMEEAQDEGVELEGVGHLDPGNSPASEQLSLQLLRSVLRGWGHFSSNAGKVGRRERRNRLMMIEADFIRISDAPVIIAGSTGSIAATAALMEAALSRANAAIVLDGVDCDLDAQSWDAVGGHPEHPQHGLYQLLARLGVSRDDIRELGAKPAAGFERRSVFLTQALRPASTTAKWRDFLNGTAGQDISSLKGFSIIEAGNIEEEAGIIALIFRETLETPGQTAALVTPDEGLIHRVQHSLARWKLIPEPAEQTSAASHFAARAAKCVMSGKPEDFAALLRHAPGDPEAPFRRFAELIDLGVLRQMWRPLHFAGIPEALARAEHAVSAGESRHPAMKRMTSAQWEAARAFSTRLLEAFAPMSELAKERLPFAEWLPAHRKVLSNLAALGIARTPGGVSFNDKLTHQLQADLMLDLSGYSGLFTEITVASDISRVESPHPRLFFWSPLESRLLSADVAVLGGLNEGCWPQALESDPWLNKRDRALAGLSAPERRIGQAAHDFVSLAAGAEQVYLTRSRKMNGSLARPSRWVSRIKALAAGAGQPNAFEPEKPWLDWAKKLHEPLAVVPIAKPEPRPSLAARPRRLSVTAIETWFANPYAIYARHILGLEPLRQLDEGSDARDKGILFHAALQRFFEAYPDKIPQDGADKLLKELDRAAETLGFNLENAPFWRPRFARFADWFAETEEARRDDLRFLKSEVGGKLKLATSAGTFEITARADRIDLLKSGPVRIYDFKTSANTAKVSVARGAPQLALEGLLAREGAFAGIPEGAQAELAYIVATGGEPPGEIVLLKGAASEVIQAAYNGILNQIARFDDPQTAYSYETRAIYKDKSDNDPYAHLARVQEWSQEVSAGENGDD